MRCCHREIGGAPSEKPCQRRDVRLERPVQWSPVTMGSRLDRQESDRPAAQTERGAANLLTVDTLFPSRRAKWEPIVRSVEWPADSWQSAQGLEAVILAGGQGTRLRTLV